MVLKRDGAQAPPNQPKYKPYKAGGNSLKTATIEVKTYTQIFKRQRKGGSYIYKTAEGEVLINQGTKDYEYFAPSHWGGWVLGTLDECLLNIYEVRDTALKYLRNVAVNPEYYGDDWEREYQIAKDYVEWTKQIDVIPVTTIQ